MFSSNVKVHLRFTASRLVQDELFFVHLRLAASRLVQDELSTLDSPMNIYAFYRILFGQHYAMRNVVSIGFGQGRRKVFWDGESKAMFNSFLWWRIRAEHGEMFGAAQNRTEDLRNARPKRCQCAINTIPFFNLSDHDEKKPSCQARRKIVPRSGFEPGSSISGNDCSTTEPREVYLLSSTTWLRECA